MNFPEKLDFLMHITKTTNSILSRQTSLDASYISRLRRGERSLSKKQNYVKSMAGYFARRCVDGYQKEAIMNVLDRTEFPAQQEKLAELLELWLLEQDPGDDETVEGFLNELSRFQFTKLPEIEAEDLLVLPKKGRTTPIYYGVEGKREAVLVFLTMVLGREEPQNLLLFSDEDMEWLIGDPVFTARWAVLMLDVLRKGHKIKIIHTVSRNLDEMLAAITQWIPLYMTGNIEPFYYPKKRDGIFKRTLFIAPGTVAVVSTSVGSMAGKAANYLLRDKKAVAAVAEEFNSYLAFCRPLMRIFLPKDRSEYLKTLYEFEREDYRAILKTESLSLLTMPSAVAEGVIARINTAHKDDLLEYFFSRKRNFENILRSNEFLEIVRIPGLSAIKEGKIQMGIPGMLEMGDLSFSPEEFRLHLENVLFLLQNYENYHVYLSDDLKEDGYMLYVKEDLGAIVAKTSMPAMVFAMNESNMTAAFWDFLYNRINYAGSAVSNKKRTINKLQAVVDLLK